MRRKEGKGERERRKEGERKEGKERKEEQRYFHALVHSPDACCACGWSWEPRAGNTSQIFLGDRNPTTCIIIAAAKGLCWWEAGVRSQNLNMNPGLLRRDRGILTARLTTRLVPCWSFVMSHDRVRLTTEWIR